MFLNIRAYCLPLSTIKSSDILQNSLSFQRWILSKSVFESLCLSRSVFNFLQSNKLSPSPLDLVSSLFEDYLLACLSQTKPSFFEQRRCFFSLLSSVFLFDLQQKLKSFIPTHYYFKGTLISKVRLEIPLGNFCCRYLLWKFLE